MNRGLKRTLWTAGVTAVATTAAYHWGASHDYIERANPHELSYQQDDAPVVHFPMLGGKTIYISNDKFEDSDRVDGEGYPLEAAETPSYHPNSRLTEPRTRDIAYDLQQLGMYCPEDAATVPYIDPEQTTTTTTAPTPPAITNPDAVEATVPEQHVQLRICLDFAKIATQGSTFIVPLMLEERSGIPQQQLNFPRVNQFCLDLGIRYAGEVNEQVVGKVSDLGLATDSSTRYPVRINMSAYHSDVCDNRAPIANLPR